MAVEPLADTQRTRGPFTILHADDDEDDRELVREALLSVRASIDTRFVTDGQDLLDYLRHTGRWDDSFNDSPRPQIILLDLNMPRMDGREALAAIKGDVHLRGIPVVVLSTSGNAHDIATTYQLGGNSFITKPGSYAGLIEVMNALLEYWSEAVRLPDRTAS